MVLAAGGSEKRDNKKDGGVSLGLNGVLLGLLAFAVSVSDRTISFNAKLAYLYC